MGKIQVELVLDARNATGESPVWRAARQELYWVDIPARKLSRLAIGSGEMTQWQAPEMIAASFPKKTSSSAGRRNNINN